jgi:hypothetical protein
MMNNKSAVPEFIDPVFTKTSPKRSFSVIQNERFGLVFAKTGSIISGTGYCINDQPEKLEVPCSTLMGGDLWLRLHVDVSTLFHRIQAPHLQIIPWLGLAWKKQCCMVKAKWQG